MECTKIQKHYQFSIKFEETLFSSLFTSFHEKFSPSCSSPRLRSSLRRVSISCRETQRDTARDSQQTQREASHARCDAKRSETFRNVPENLQKRPLANVSQSRMFMRLFHTCWFIITLCHLCLFSYVTISILVNCMFFFRAGCKTTAAPQQSKYGSLASEDPQGRQSWAQMKIMKGPPQLWCTQNSWRMFRQPLILSGIGQNSKLISSIYTNMHLIEFDTLIYISISISNLSICLSVYLSIHPSLYLSIYICIYIYICM